MNLLELRNKVELAIESAKEYGDDPIDIEVSIQIDCDAFPNSYSIYSDDIKLHYDGDGCASGCVFVGYISE